MKTKAVRLYGKEDLRLEEFELPQMNDDEILAKVVSDSICMSSYKSSHQGTDHKRVPNDIAEHPTIIGHEFAGEIVEVGSKWKDQFKPGDKFSIQPALNYEGGPVGVLSAPGYSYRYIGGDATYIIIPAEVMEQGCLLPYNGPGFYPASLSEPLSCVIGAMHACYHTTPGSYVHKMEIKDGGKLALLAGVGPMGLAMINYVLRREDRRPSLFVVTDIDQARLDRAATLSGCCVTMMLYICILPVFEARIPHSRMRFILSCSMARLWNLRMLRWLLRRSMVFIVYVFLAY